MDKRILGDPGTASFQVDKYPFFLLNRLVSRYNAVVLPVLHGIGIDVPYWRVLMILGERSPRGVREIADAAVIPLSTMTRIIQRMHAAGLVLAGAKAKDARVTEVRLSKGGEAKLEEARAMTSPIYQRVIAGISAMEFDILIDLLDRLHGNLSEASGVSGRHAQEEPAASEEADIRNDRLYD